MVKIKMISPREQGYIAHLLPHSASSNSFIPIDLYSIKTFHTNTMLSSILALPLLAGAVLASPLNRREMNSYTQDVEIHESCNSTQRRMLEDAFA